jgi:UDP-glucose 4-epimerase
MADLLSIDIQELLRQEQPDVVFHLATSSFVPPSLDDPYGDLLSNTGTTVRLLDALRRSALPPLLVVVSSAAVYGSPEQLPITEDHPLKPISPYGVAKQSAESYVGLFRSLYQLPLLIVRPFSLYGPGLRKQVVFDLTRRLLAGEYPLVVHAPAAVSRDLVYVSDAAAMIAGLARTAPGEAEAYNICSGTETTMQQLVTGLQRATETDTGASFAPANAPGYPDRWVGSPERSASGQGLGCDRRVDSQ